MNQYPDHVQLMDQVYRYQRYFYDFTRKYYLFGRDTLIREMDVHDGDHVLEMGCGTARNLISLAQKHPKAFFYGLDASNEMLKTAESKVKSKGLENRIVLQQCLAEQVNHKDTFDLDQPFDSVFFSYSLTMIPTWKDAITAAIANLKPGGYIYIVDFGIRKIYRHGFENS
jgi:S-adenosylmethionine-diacylgycerolhomoserine-N-methlytransferase